MLGYDMEWAAFNILEVMSNPSFTLKRAGYLAASQSFTKDTDVMILTSQTFRRVCISMLAILHSVFFLCGGHMFLTTIFRSHFLVIVVL